MTIDLAPAPAAVPHGSLVLAFSKVVYAPDAKLVAALQDAGIVERFKYGPRALNTKVLVFPWVPPRSADEAAAQVKALKSHPAIAEARGFALPALRAHYLDTDHAPKKVEYIDGGELVLAFAAAHPEQLREAWTYLRAPQRHDWFLDRLVAIAEKAKDPKAGAPVWTMIAEMPVPPASNKHHKAFVAALARGAEVCRAAGDAAGAARLAGRAGDLAPKAKATKAAPAAKAKAKATTKKKR